VLLTGGINDVGVWRILNPLVPLEDIDAAVYRHCFTHVVELLKAVVAKFDQSRSLIVLSGYYPILSVSSHPPLVAKFLQALGCSALQLPALPLFSLGADPVTSEIVKRCALFYQSSDKALGQAVAQVNSATPGSPRILFATSQFGHENAALAPAAWLWGIDVDGLPEDIPVAAARQPACDAHELNPFRRFTCYRASAGHPNTQGAKQYAKAIYEAFAHAR